MAHRERLTGWVVFGVVIETDPDASHEAGIDVVDGLAAAGNDSACLRGLVSTARCPQLSCELKRYGVAGRVDCVCGQRYCSKACLGILLRRERLDHSAPCPWFRCLQPGRGHQVGRIRFRGEQHRDPFCHDRQYRYRRAGWSVFGFRSAIPTRHCRPQCRSPFHDRLYTRDDRVLKRCSAGRHDGCGSHGFGDAAPAASCLRNTGSQRQRSATIPTHSEA
jgi:hypothetical protein